MSGMLMIRNAKKNTLNMEKFNENLSIKFLKKRMKKLNNELGFMSSYVYRIRTKLNHSAGDLWIGDQKRAEQLGSESTQSQG